MKNFYLYLAGIALFASGARMTGTLSNGPSASQEWIAQKENQSLKTERIPYARARKKSNAKVFLAPGISATNTAAITNNVGLAGASAGDELEYTVTIANGGPNPANGTTFSEKIDVNTTLVAGSVKASPIAQDDNYATIGNVGINIPAGTGLFINDISPAATAFNLNSTTTVTTTGGGTVVITAATGAFTYEPLAGYTGNDTFTYEIQNGSGMTSTATVTIAVGIGNNAIWFINTTGSAGGSGTLAKPFNNIADFQSINNDGLGLHPKNGHIIFLYSGSYTGPLTLRNNQKLLGQGSTQSLLDFTGFSAPNGVNSLPGTNGTRPTITTSAGTDNAISLAATNNIKGLNIGNTSGTKIAGSAAGTLTISEVGLSGSGSSLNLSNKVLAASFSDVTSTSATNSISPIKIASSSGSLTILGGNITAVSVPAVDISGNIALNVTLTSVSANGGSKGLILSGTTGTFQINGTGTSLGTGGTIKNIAVRGIELLNTAGITIKNMNLENANTEDGPAPSERINTDSKAAIHGLNVAGLTLDRVHISGTVVQMGINLRGGSNFSFTNGSVGKSGSQGNVEEGCIYAQNVGGTNTITNSTFTDPGGRAAYFSNENVNMTRLNVNNSTFQDADAASGLLFEGRGNSIMSVQIQNSQFLKCRSSGIEIYANNSSQLEAEIETNTIDIGTGDDFGKGIDVASAGSATIKFNVNGNTSDYLLGPCLNFFAFSQSYLEGNVTNNVLTNNADVEGEGSFMGITFSTEGTTARGILKITGNKINNSRNGIGIGVLPASTGGALSSVIVDNNTVTLTGNGFANGIYLNAVGGVNNNGTLCAYAANNKITLSPNSPIAGGYRAGTTGTTLQVQGTGPNVVSAWNGNGNTPANSAAKTGNGTVTFISASPGCPTPAFSGLRMAIKEKPVAGRLSADSVAVPVATAVQQVAVETPALTVMEDEVAETAASRPARTEAVQSGETVTVNGTGSGFVLPANKNTIIKFKVTINNNIPVSACQVSTQGTISGSNFDNVQTDDPGAAGANDPTIMQIVSVPVITFCPGDRTVSPDGGTCTSTQTLAATVDGCPAPTIIYRVGGNPITFPYAFPVGVTTVLVTASNGIGTAPTCSFKVTVTPTPAPLITDEPDAQTICTGSGTSFTVASSQAGVTYQWQKKLFGGAFADIMVGSNATADDATLTLTNVPAADNQSEYRCVVSNPCNSTTSAAVILTVNGITSSSSTGTTMVNQGAAAPVVTFGATGGTLPYTFTYQINNGSSLTVTTTNIQTTAMVSQPTNVVGVFTYKLVSVSDAQSCSLTPSSAQTAVVTVANNLTATILKTVSVCQNATQPVITFTAVNGIAPFTFTYHIDGGPEQNVSTTGVNTVAAVNAPTSATGTFVYTLTNVSGAGNASTSVAAQAATVTVNETPTIALTGKQYECTTGLNSYSVFFTASAGAVVTSDKGVVNGNSVTGIPSHETAILTATLGTCSTLLSVFKDCSLPVTLIDFEGFNVENTAVLKWRTAEETNSDLFDIQRSNNGKDWQTVGTEKSHGESYAVKSYSFVDKKPGAGDNFYRLKMLDRDNTFAYSQVIKVRFANELLKSEFHPNPVSEVIYLTSTDWNKVKSVEIHNMTGNPVYRSGKTVSKTVSVKDLPVGMYILTFTYLNGEIVTRKVLVNH